MIILFIYFLSRKFESSVSSHRPCPALTHAHVCRRQVTSENSMISYVHRSPSLRRYFTTCCGTRLFFTHCDANLQMWGLFPALFPTYNFPTPTLELHVRESRVHSLNLVAYNDLPIEFGGSGKLMGGALSNLEKENQDGKNPDAGAK